MVHKYHHQPAPLEADVDERRHEGPTFMMDPLGRPAHHPDDVHTLTVDTVRHPPSDAPPNAAPSATNAPSIRHPPPTMMSGHSNDPEDDDSDGAAEPSPKRPRQHHDGSLEDSLPNNNNNDSTMMMMARVMEESEGLVAATTTTAAVATASALAEGDVAAAAKKQVHNEQWNEMLERLVAFKAEYGHCLVPKRFAEDPRLGTWVETQRVQYKRLVRIFDRDLQQEIPQPNKRLTAERLAKLHQLGFCWSAKNVRKMPATNTTISPGTTEPDGIGPSTTTTSPGVLPSTTHHHHHHQLLPTAVRLYHHVPEATTTDTPTLPRRQATTAAMVTVTTGTAAAATSPGAAEDAFDPLPASATTSDDLWDDFYHRLVQFREWHGHTLVPRKYETDPKLSTWVEQQRAAWNRDYNKPTILPTPTTPVTNSSNTSGVDNHQYTTPFANPDDDDDNDEDDEDAMWNVVAMETNMTPMHSPLMQATPPPPQPPPPYKKLSLERKQKLDALGFVWSLRSKRIGDHWDEMFRQLIEYKNQHGDCLVPSRYEANLKLGKWVETQRYEYTKLQRATSDTDDPVSSIPLAATITTTTTPTLKIANNATNTNSSSNRCANPRLTPERLHRLESIGFEWKVKNKMKRYYDKLWDGMFQTLLDFKKKYGHCNVPKRFSENARLGTWVHTQRIQYRRLVNGTNQKGSGKSSPGEGPSITDRTDGPPPSSPLENEAMALDSEPRQATEEASANPHDYNGESSAAMAKATAANSPAGEPNNGVPAFLTEAGFVEDKSSGISNWTAEQFQSFRLTDARLKRLEAIGFCWTAREGNEKATLLEAPISRNSYDDQWDAMFAQLERFKQVKGNCLVPKRYPENPKLGTWVDTQRVQYKKMLKKIAQMQHDRHLDDNASRGSTLGSATPLVGRLTQDRIHRLQNLGFVWSLRDDWAKHYEELKEYKAIHGHCNVPARYTPNRRLGIWVSAQRQHYKMLQHNEQLDQMDADQSASPNNDNPTGADSGDATPKLRRPAPLTPERVDLLNFLGFTWTIRSRDALGESWNQRFQELRQFKQEHGHCLVPSRYDKNPELGIWVGTQRSQYRLFMRARETGQSVSTNMNDDRIRELEDLGFVWALRGSMPEDAIAAAEAAAAAVEIADQVAVVATDVDVHHLPHRHHHHHGGDDPILVGHHVEPTILDYHPYPVSTMHHHDNNHPHDPHDPSHDPTMELGDSVNASCIAENDTSNKGN